MNIILIYRNKYQKKEPEELKVISPREGVRATKKALVFLVSAPWNYLTFKIFIQITLTKLNLN